MSHLPILPVLVPSLAAIIMLLPPLAKSVSRQRTIAWLAFAIMAVVCWQLVASVSHGTTIYVLGGWQPPFGIMLLVDHLSVMLVVLTTFLAFCACLYGSAGEELTGRFFYPLFMFQLMGINGAFLTGDIFNLFVFFEVLLIASYALLIHGGGKEKTGAAFHYITLNLLGSAFFLIALGTLYGTLGTLNMADMAAKVATLPPEEQAITKAGALLLLLVFGLKSAMLPLHFWLAKTYSAAPPPVAALFAIMTKVGLYSIFRVFGGIFGADAGALANMADAWIWPLGLATIVIGSLGVLASPSLRLLAANVIIVSVGTLLLSFVVSDGQSLSAGLYYLVHSTLVGGALFLIADLIKVQRGSAQDRFVIARAMAQPGLLGAMFFTAAICAVGLPPLSGFVGKALILNSISEPLERTWVWSSILLSSLIALVVFSRAGTSLFWHLSGKKAGETKAQPAQIAAIALLLLVTPVITVFAHPVTEFAQQAANDIADSMHLVQDIIAHPPEVNYEAH
ncbi:monovalent cation/H+ antiporter subunit D [Reinekea marinisedimentorum]|uniref:Multicomponent K+:H+ antiporter subunit D n=1 Tax=Reinekea marinisedimentorum TaxID=230495 RepID=A0A4R3IBS2_9GAMM|nr:monovalent cation/H+ antiporter subunit D [Reinekea marinisedimentorum]TCS44090.1 multicomponent K+:H+ antiporter subunit D [Reinekea marinisedimentorum]